MIPRLPMSRSRFSGTPHFVGASDTMALHHASSGELIDIRPIGQALVHAVTRTLYKSRHLQVFRMVLLAGKTAPPHSVPGDITVQCLEGSLEFTSDGVTQVMRQGDLVCLAGGVPHALTALEDTSVLVTLRRHQA